MSRELDAKVAGELMGWSKILHDGWGHWNGDPPPGWVNFHGEHCTSSDVLYFTSDIAAAWRVHQMVCSTWLFSKRKRYLDHLHLIASVSLESGQSVAWPDVLVVLADRMPEAICQAALASVIN